MESISRVGSMLETARDLTLEAARDAGPRKSTRPLPAAQIKKLLDSRNERDVLDGLRRVVAMQYANPPQSTLAFFPAVLKSLSTPYPSTRPLVYSYLIYHAEADPDTALLAINTIQKSLSDSNPRVRAMALKTMSGIRVPVISQIVSLAIKKGASDLSPLVRKAAALACVKCVRLDFNTKPKVQEYLSALLADNQYYVAGAAVQAFMEVCPDRLELIHPVYRGLCKMIVDMDEWGQLSLIKLLTVYSRKCFPRQTKRVKRAATQEQRAKDFYGDIDLAEENENCYEEVEFVDPDLELFLKGIQSLLSSRNSAVIVAVTRAYLYLSPNDYLHHAIGPLIALLRSPSDIQQVALYNIVQVCLLNPSLFSKYFRHFLIRSIEGPLVWQLKLEILTLIFPHSGKEVQELILAELEHFSKGYDRDLVRESVRAIGRCAQSSDASTSRRCLSLLLRQIHSTDTNLVGEAMEVIRLLIQRSPHEHRKTVVRLAKNLDALASPTARASVVWLVGEFAGLDPDDNIAADVLRILIKGYADEDDEVRAQILLLATKVYLHHLNAKNEDQKARDALNTASSPPEAFLPSVVLSPEEEEEEEGGGFRENAFGSHGTNQKDEEPEKKHIIELLYEHVMLLARYTPSYDLRDRARVFRALLAIQSSIELASLLLLAPKPVPQAPSPSESRKDLALGTSALVVGEAVGVTGMRAHEPFPPWVQAGHEPDPKLRDDGDATAKSAEYGANKTFAASMQLDEALKVDPSYKSNEKGNRGVKKVQSLDAWLDEEEEETEEDSDEEDDDDEETESEDDEDGSESEETDSEEDDEKTQLVK